MELVYARFNRHRLPPFQIETAIFRDGDSRWVRKRALTDAAAQHIKRLFTNQAIIQNCLRGDRMRLPQCELLDNRTLRYEYIDGCGFDHLLFAAFRARAESRFMALLREYRELLQTSFKTAKQSPSPAAEQSLFGSPAAAEESVAGTLLNPALIDPVFENLILRKNTYFLIDQEWVFDACVPLDFVIYRSLFYFYERYKEFGLPQWLPLSGILETQGIGREKEKNFRAMEENFQAHVFGRERCYRYRERYAKHAHSVPSLLETIEHQRQVVREYHNAMENMRRNIQTSLTWRFSRKAGQIIDFCLPPETLRRRMFNRLIHRNLSAQTTPPEQAIQEG